MTTDRRRERRDATKNEILAEAWSLAREDMHVFLVEDARLQSSGHPQREIAATTRWFVEFGAADRARYPLIFQRTIPGFAPSATTFALAVEALERQRARLVALGFHEP